MVKNVDLRDCKIKLVKCTPQAVDGFLNIIFQNTKTTFILQNFKSSYLKREGLALVRMLRTISVFLFGSLTPFSFCQHHDHAECRFRDAGSGVTEMETICLLWTFHHRMPLSFAHCRQRSSRASPAKIDDTRCKGAHIRQSG